MAIHLCSCLEHLRDGGAWWAAVYGVTQSQTLLKLLSSSYSSMISSLGTTALFPSNVTLGDIGGQDLNT